MIFWKIFQIQCKNLIYINMFKDCSITLISGEREIRTWCTLILAFSAWAEIHVPLLQKSELLEMFLLQFKKKKEKKKKKITNRPLPHRKSYQSGAKPNSQTPPTPRQNPLNSLQVSQVNLISEWSTLTMYEVQSFR